MSDAKIQRQRTRIIIVLVSVVGILIIARLFTLQVIQSKRYQERAERQYVTPANGSFDRGTIYFTGKDGATVAAATVARGFKAAIVPRLIIDSDRTYELFNAISPIDHDDFFTKVAKKQDPYEEIKTHISEKDGARISELALPGLTLYRDKWRFYPGGELGSNTIGFVSYRGDGLAGTYGLEEYYNDILARDESSLYVNFFAEVFANVQSTIFKNTATTGDIITSIEPTVQSELEQSIKGIHSKWGSDTVGGIVMDPYTGEIVAMATAPTFDANNYGSNENAAAFSNPFAQSRYEMGSIVKPLVVAAALDVGAITPQTSYLDTTGSITINGKVISNFDKKGRGTANMQQVLNESLNTGMVFIQQKMGKETFRQYLVDRYKLGEKTGIDLPGEVNGQVASLKGANDVNYATASFGQGIATSPINIVRGFATLANGGTLVTPHIATTIIESNGTRTQINHPTSPSVLKPETVSTITNMLVHVVDDGYHRGLPHYRVAAKTGTAQIARSDGGGYYSDRNLHSLIGFFPASKPRYVLYLFNVYPKGALYAIQTLADPFFGMIEFLGNYYDIPPDR